MRTRVAIVTDSTSGLAGGAAGDVEVVVVPLHVLLDGTDFREGVDIGSEDIAGKLAKGRRAGTSRPSPREFLATYERLAAGGVRDIVSIHLSGQLSGTWEAATLAARDAPVPVRVVDSGVVAGALAQSVRAAAVAVSVTAEAGDADGPVDRAVEAVRRSAESAATLFYVHSLDHLRKGGRIGAASAFLGGALAVKPLLEVTEGHIEPLEKLRTQGRALTRLQEIVVERARDVGTRVDLLVHHVGAAVRAGKLAERLSAAVEQAGVEGGPPRVVPLPAALAVHVGPEALGVVVTPAWEDEADRIVAGALDFAR